MKTLLLSIIAAVLFSAGITPAWAGTCPPPPVAYCQPYKVRTVELYRQRVSQVRYDHCGRAYTVWFTVVTYQDVWSNGAWRNYQVAFQG